MTNNDVLRRVRYALNLNNSAMMEIFRLAQYEMRQGALTAFLKKEEEEGYAECPDPILQSFLNGLIVFKRGKREGDPQPERTEEPISNNLILKKLRIALELREDDLLATMKLAGFPLSKSELSALFRAKGHNNYKTCGDQVLRNFLKGLTLRLREE